MINLTHEINSVVRVQVENQVSDHTGNHIWIRVYNHSWRLVRKQVWDQVGIDIEIDIKEDTYDKLD